MPRESVPFKLSLARIPIETGVFMKVCATSSRAIGLRPLDVSVWQVTFTIKRPVSQPVILQIS